MSGVRWDRNEDAHGVHVGWGGAQHFAVARFNKQWLLVDQETLNWWYSVKRRDKEQRLKGHRRFPTKEAAMAAARLIYG